MLRVMLRACMRAEKEKGKEAKKRKRKDKDKEMKYRWCYMVWMMEQVAN